MDNPNEYTAADDRTGIYESALDSLAGLNSTNGNDDDDDDFVTPLEQAKRAHSLILSSSSSVSSDQLQFSKKVKENNHLFKIESTLNSNTNNNPPLQH